MNNKPPVWRDSESVCALADGERHLGHILNIDERWYAFDGTHFDEQSNGFLRLGSFASRQSAKEAVEFSSSSLLKYAGAA